LTTQRRFKAVILAAGQGVRIQGVSGHMPKSLLEIGPVSHNNPQKTTFLERQINCLKEAGVTQIVVVVGYNKEKIYEKLDSQSDIMIVENTAPNIAESGSLHSFQFAMNSDFAPLDGVSNTLLLDADIVYEQKMISEYVEKISGTSSLISSNINTDSEEVRIYGEDQQPAFIGKGLTPSLVGNARCIGEATGIVHFAPEDHQLVKEATNWFLGNPFSPTESMEYKGFGPAKKKTEHEDLSQHLMSLRKMDACVVDKDVLFMEVDFENEYQVLKSKYYPQILEADSHL
jgi:choline kinase